MRKIWLARLALVAIALAIPFGLLEWRLRRLVGRNGLTPFATATIQGLPHQLRPSFTTLYKGVPVHLNAHGFRGPEFPARREEVTRIVCVGDSITFGNGVADSATLPAQLERALKARGEPVEVLNCGVPGYNAASVGVVVEHQALELQPDVLIYVFVSNDLIKVGKADEIPPDAVIDEFASFPLRSAALQWLGVRARALLRALGLGQGSGWVASVLKPIESGGRDLLRSTLESMRARCQEQGVRFLVAVYPFLVARKHNPFLDVEALALDLCRQHGIEGIHLAGAFEDGEDLRRYWVNPFDSHPDPTAHRKAAEYLAEHLTP